MDNRLCRGDEIMEYRQFGEKFVIRLAKGEKIIAVLLEFCSKNNIKNGYFLGLASIINVELAHYNVNTKKFSSKIIDEICEVGTMYGNISFFEGKPYIHCHISIGKDDFTGMAGHLKGAEVAATAEITLISLGGSVGRKYSDEIGLNLYEF